MLMLKAIGVQTTSRSIAGKGTNVKIFICENFIFDNTLKNSNLTKQAKMQAKKFFANATFYEFYNYICEKSAKNAIRPLT